MKPMKNSHLTDEQILLSLEGELSGRRQRQVRAHLDACWQCRVHSSTLEQSIADYVAAHRCELEADLPSIDGPRALLRARMEQLVQASPNSPHGRNAFRRGFSLAFALFGVMAAGLLVAHWVGVWPTLASTRVVFSSPDAALTPGATLISTRQKVCAQANIKNKSVSRALQRKVFEEYGIPGADPRAYEVDYLVTPALGGADDIRNLWPHSYSATVWNAQVKDELEDRLHDLVCGGNLELSEAQQEIAQNWIAAYKKYFHTGQPLSGH